MKKIVATHLEVIEVRVETLAKKEFVWSLTESLSKSEKATLKKHGCVTILDSSIRRSEAIKALRCLNREYPNKAVFKCLLELIDINSVGQFGKVQKEMRQLGVQGEEVNPIKPERTILGAEVAVIGLWIGRAPWHEFGHRVLNNMFFNCHFDRTVLNWKVAMPVEGKAPLSFLAMLQSSIATVASDETLRNFGGYYECGRVAKTALLQSLENTNKDWKILSEILIKAAGSANECVLALGIIALLNYLPIRNVNRYVMSVGVLIPVLSSVFMYSSSETGDWQNVQQELLKLNPGSDPEKTIKIAQGMLVPLMMLGIALNQYCIRSRLDPDTLAVSPLLRELGFTSISTVEAKKAVLKYLEVPYTSGFEVVELVATAAKLMQVFGPVFKYLEDSNLGNRALASPQMKIVAAIVGLIADGAKDIHQVVQYARVGQRAIAKISALKSALTLGAVVLNCVEENPFTGILSYTVLAILRTALTRVQIKKLQKEVNDRLYEKLIQTADLKELIALQKEGYQGFSEPQKKAADEALEHQVIRENPSEQMVKDLLEALSRGQLKFKTEGGIEIELPKNRLYKEQYQEIQSKFSKEAKKIFGTLLLDSNKVFEVVSNTDLIILQDLYDLAISVDAKKITLALNVALLIKLEKFEEYLSVVRPIILKSSESITRRTLLAQLRGVVDKNPQRQKSWVAEENRELVQLCEEDKIREEELQKAIKSKKRRELKIVNCESIKNILRNTTLSLLNTGTSFVFLMNADNALQRATRGYVGVASIFDRVRPLLNSSRVSEVFLGQIERMGVQCAYYMESVGNLVGRCGEIPLLEAQRNFSAHQYVFRDINNIKISGMLPITEDLRVEHPTTLQFALTGTSIFQRVTLQNILVSMGIAFSLQCLPGRSRAMEFFRRHAILFGVSIANGLTALDPILQLGNLERDVQFDNNQRYGKVGLIESMSLGPNGNSSFVVDITEAVIPFARIPTMADINTENLMPSINRMAWVLVLMPALYILVCMMMHVWNGHYRQR